MDENKSMELFLKETHYCDYGNGEIQKIALAYSKKYTNKKDLSIALFNFVRDKIKYRIGPWNKKASETLSDGFGMCTNSANLLVALLRAVNIPAGYCIYKVVGGESFGHILPSIIKPSIHKDSVHIVCCVYLNRWIKCDPSTDFELSERTKHISNLTELIVWDGEHDAVHPMEYNTIISISEPLWNIDQQLLKKPRHIVRYYVFHVGNIFIDFLRKEGLELQNKEELNRKFKHWFRKNHSFHYYRYIIISSYYQTYRKCHRAINRLYKKLK